VVLVAVAEEDFVGVWVMQEVADVDGMEEGVLDAVRARGEEVAVARFGGPCLNVAVAWTCVVLEEWCE
jgi:hypothetical protein